MPSMLKKQSIYAQDFALSSVQVSELGSNTIKLRCGFLPSASAATRPSQVIYKRWMIRFSKKCGSRSDHSEENCFDWVSRVSKLKAIVRYMFHNSDDVKWFKPVELWTKHGRQGRIKETVLMMAVTIGDASTSRTNTASSALPTNLP
ncbi:uncharacterized protein LOC120660790 isoform X2 [Panicum virgatum]|uniref:uncharacterized protein LOC120660790 isoform X2 n=1 Tax=Panicum virgatum TaxID=38727 RepID=UPI0019D607FE|nr:uncharacterized protein LOC120660790 isoform X2 [Panicum virgatum]XP_039795361.1 uncharacterized protein LOC120660790 isoform X2 [Panicum virgatum]